MSETFERFTDDEMRFSKTSIPLKLAEFEGERLLSRSQARRIMTRVEKFSEVRLDFEGIAEIGQAFADEIFRVWAREHPRARLHPIAMSKAVERMVSHALANAKEDAGQSSGSSSSPSGERRQ